MTEENKVEESSVSDEVKEIIVYVKDRPIIELVKITLAIILVSIVVIYGAGFIMGIMKIRTPYIDSEAINNQINSLIGEQSDYKWNELEPLE